MSHDGEDSRRYTSVHMYDSISTMMTRSFVCRHRILSVFCVLIAAILLICFDASSWRTIETNDASTIAHFYTPFQHDSSRLRSNNGTKKFKINIGPLWRCLTTTMINGKRVISRECIINSESFDYIILSMGIGTFIFAILISISIAGQCLIKSHLTIARLLLVGLLELATLWLLYGFFYLQTIFGPLYGWASIGFFLCTILVIVICVLEWDDYFRSTCKTTCHLNDNDDKIFERKKTERLNAWVSKTIHTEIDQI